MDRKLRVNVLGVWLGVFLWVGQVVAESEPQKIALLVPLTGALADWGVGMEKGARMALEESNSPVKLLVEDSQFDPKAALLALERLRTTNRLDALIVFGSSVSLAVANIAESNQLLTISIATSDQIQRGKKYVFRHMISVQTATDVLQPEVLRRNYQRIAAVSTTQDGMLAFQEALVERLSARIVLKADVAPQERELRGLAVRTLASKPDAVYLTLLPPQSSLFTKQLRQLGFQGEFFAATQIENRAEIIAAGEAFEGLWYVKDGDTESIKFERRFFERYQTQPDNFASNAYDTLRLLIQALSQPNPTHALEGVTDFHGALGSYRALPDHSFSIPGMLRIIRNTKVNSLESNIAGSAFF